MNRRDNRARGAVVLVVALVVLLGGTLAIPKATHALLSHKKAPDTSNTPARSQDDPRRSTGPGQTGTRISDEFIEGLSGEPAAPAPSDPPTDTTMRLTVPRMSRVQDIPVKTAESSNAAVLDNGALHAEGTGYPWQKEANVYIAGHRLGYPGTNSYMLFLDLPRLKTGDEIILTDAKARRYVYRVFESFKVRPDEISVMEPVPGESVISLQTCTLPDYAERLIVRGRLIDHDPTRAF